MKSKQALEEIINDHLHSVIEYYYNSNISKERRDELCDKYDDKFEVIKKDLEALEIIKNKQVDILWLNKCDTCAAYNSWMGLQRMLTEDEFKSLKEALNNDK